MPELPEVETIKRELRELVTGALISRIEPHDLKVASSSITKAEGMKVLEVQRKGKFLYWVLSRGALGFHLRMTGFFSLIENPYKRITIELQRGRKRESLYFCSVRRFSRVSFLTPTQLQRKLALLGKDFLEVRLPEFWSALKEHHKTLYSFLLDQAIFSGLGNIYAQEALFLAKISPFILSDTLEKEEAKNLFQSIKKVLREGIKEGGVSIANYRKVSGEKGRYQLRLRVYRKEICPVCQKKLTKKKVSGRAVRWCQACQD